MLMFLLATVANAQLADAFPLPDMNAQLYRAPIDAQRTMWTDDTARGPHLWYTGRVYTQYVHGPIAAVFLGDRKVQVLGDVLGLNLVGGMQFGPVRVGADVPVYAVATTGWDDLGGGGLGDIALDVKATLLERQTAPLGIAFGARMGLPTATVKVPLGSPKVQSEIQGIFDKEVGDVLLALNVGARFGPRVQQDNLDLNDAFMVRFGAGYNITEMAGVSLDVQMLNDLLQPSTPTEDFSAIGVPVEAMLGGWGRVTKEVVLRGGLGRGLTHGIGAPAFRAVFSAGYEPSREGDRDRDGFADSLDGCPDDPEDKDGYEDTDGCPELDNDADGILDVSDACPMQPEDIDGWIDEDGCPDPTLVRVSVVDPDGVPVAGVQAVIAVGDEDAKTGGAEFEVELETGDYKLEATAEEYNDLTASFTVPGGPPMDLRRIMDSAKVRGTVRASMQDAAGASVDGQISWSDDDSTATEGGKADLSIREGRYALTASAEGYFDDARSVDVVAGEESEVVFTMSKTQGSVTVTVVDSDGLAIADATYTFGDDGVEHELDGKSTEADVAPGDYTVIARAEGYAPARAAVKVSAGAESSVTLTLSETKVRVSLQKIEILEKVFFNTGRSTIKTQSHALLDEVAQILRDRRDITEVRIEGHTDSRGSEASNQLLSERRAAAVRAYLVDAGINGSRLTSVGLGEAQPIDPAQNEAAWAENRRVEFVIVPSAE